APARRLHREQLERTGGAAVEKAPAGDRELAGIGQVGAGSQGRAADAQPLAVRQLDIGPDVGVERAYPSLEHLSRRERVEPAVVGPDLLGDRHSLGRLLDEVRTAVEGLDQQLTREALEA